MEITSFSKQLCNYVISKQQSDLFVIFENFQDRISNPENNTFFIQNQVLDRMLTIIEESKRNTITLSSLYKGITPLEKSIIEPLEIENRLIYNAKHSKIIGVEYFDEDKFMQVIDEKLESIATKYNLNADDDYNKLYMFLSSLQLSLVSSDDILIALSNQFTFFSEHSSKYNDEYITIYGEKHYKIDILKELISSYNELISKDKIKNVNNLKSKSTR